MLQNQKPKKIRNRLILGISLFVTIFIIAGFVLPVIFNMGQIGDGICILLGANYHHFWGSDYMWQETPAWNGRRDIMGFLSLLGCVIQYQCQDFDTPQMWLENFQ